MNCINRNHITDLNIKNVIYGLIDPDTNEIRYIGKAIDLKTRIRNHYKPSRLISKTHKNNWINLLIKEGKRPLVTVLELDLDEEQLNEFEIKWISNYKKIGCKLTNGTDGGDGGKISQEALEKMKQTKALNKQEGFWLNKIFSEEHCRNISEGKKGYTASEETRKKLSKSLKGKNTWVKGRKVSEETRVKMSESRLGKPKNEKRFIN